MGTHPHTSTSSSSVASLWQLLRTTPLRDVCMGRLTGRLAITHQVTQANLPEPLASLVIDVVRRTRLSRLEKADVARELIAHFADGLDAGHSAEQLHHDFGDSTQAAMLIRRSTKRNRPWPWRAAVFSLKATLLTIGVILSIYVAMAVRFYLGKPGEIIDYRPQINAKAATISEEQKAWPLYREALLVLPSPLPDKTIDVMRFARVPMPGEEGWDDIEQFLQEARPALVYARTAASLAGLGLMVGYALTDEDLRLYPGISEILDDNITSPKSAGLIGIALPHLASLRKLARVLALDVQRAAAAGDSKDLVSDIKSLLAIAGHSRETPLLISDLVGIAVLTLACEQLGWVVHQYPTSLNDEELADITHLLGAFNDDVLRVELAGERLFFLDVLQRAYTDNGRGDGRLTPNGIRWFASASTLSEGGDSGEALLEHLAGPAVGALMLGRREMHDQHTRLMNMLEAEALTPLWMREHSQVEQIIEQWNSSPIDRMRYLPLCLLMPALSKAALASEMAMLRRDATLVALTAELYRRKYGDWPASIDDLVPTYLPSVPIDRFDGQQLRYVVRDGKPLVYSVGTNRLDDGGVLPVQGLPSDRQWYSRRWVPPSELLPNPVSGMNLPDGTNGPVYNGDYLLWPPLPQPPLLHNTSHATFDPDSE